MRARDDKAPPVIRRGLIAAQAIALVLLLASTWVVVSVALSGAGAGAVSAGRALFAALGLFGIAIMSQRSKPSISATVREVGNYRPGQLALLSGTGVVGYTVLSTAAISLAGPTMPSLVLSLSPAVILVLESAFLRRTVSIAGLLATLAAIGGAAIYVVPKLDGTVNAATGPGLLAALGAMASMTIYSLYFARVNRGYGGPMTRRILPIYALGSLPLIVWAAGEIALGHPVTSGTVAVLAVLGIVIYVPAYILQHRILLAAGPAFVSLLGLAVAPIVGLSSAALGLADYPAPIQIGGILLTLAGMTVVILVKFRTATIPATDGGSSVQSR